MYIYVYIYICIFPLVLVITPKTDNQAYPASVFSSKLGQAAS